MWRRVWNLFCMIRWCESWIQTLNLWLTYNFEVWLTEDIVLFKFDAWVLVIKIKEIMISTDGGMMDTLKVLNFGKLKMFSEVICVNMFDCDPLFVVWFAYIIDSKLSRVETSVSCRSWNLIITLHTPINIFIIYIFIYDIVTNRTTNIRHNINECDISCKC